MALVTRFLLPKHSKHTTTDEIFTEGKAERQLQVTQISSSWKRLLLPKQDATKSQWVPNLSGIVKAGDEGLFSSALFTGLQGHPGQVPLDSLYQAFSSEIRTRPLAERSSYPGDMTKFLVRTKKPASSVSRSKSMSQIKRVEPSQKSQRKSLDLSVAEMGLTRSLSVKKSASALVSVRNGLQDDGSQKAAQKSWVKDGQTAKYHSGQTNVKVTPAELTALAIILGSEPNKNVDRQLAIPETSAYGISIVSTRAEDSKHHITLTQHKRSRSQRHAQGSKVSPLFAKHLAAGSLPYSQDKLGVHSILITDEAFEALQAGASLYTHPYVARTPQSKFVTSLPNSREPRFHILATSTEVHTSTTLLDAIAALPFSSGLAPLASAPLIKTVQFVASGGLPPAKLLQRLEGLVDKVHRHSPHLNIFGPLYEPQNAGVLYRERDRLGRLASDPSTPDTLADKTARMSRYMTLLERLMALVPDLKPQDVLEAVQEATKTEIQRSYERAVVAHTPQSHTRKSADFTTRRLSDTQPKRHSTSPRSSPPRRSNRSSVLSNVTTPSVLSNEERDRNLAKQLEQVLKAELPLDVAMIAFVARMVLVAWTLSVRVVAWEDGKEGYRVPDLDGWGKMVMS